MNGESSSSLKNEESDIWARFTSTQYAIVIAVIATSLTRCALAYRRTPKVYSVGFPTIPIPILSSWLATYRFMRDPVGCVRRGVESSKNAIFRIATIQGEYILVADKSKVIEYLKAPDSVLSMQDGANDQQQIPFTMGYGVGHRTYHTPVVKSQLTPRIPTFTPLMVDEVSAAFDDYIGSPKEYVSTAFYDLIASTVARVSTRVFVNDDLAKNSEYLKNSTDYAQAVVISAEILRLLQVDWIKKLVVQFLPVASCRRKGFEYLGPLIREELSKKNDSDSDTSQNLIRWLVDAAPPIEKTEWQISERIMALNVASIHTTTMTFTAAIYSLAMEPGKYLDPLRNEVVENLEAGAVTNKTVNNCYRMDSFLRESARYNDSGLMTMQRNARQSFKFADGTVIPAGSKIGTPSLILHRDASSYDNPHQFEGFRFVKYDDDGIPIGVHKLMVTTAADFHLFGHGRHPCPGRFFATHEMKVMFAILLLRYDIKLEADARPQMQIIATMALPDTKLKVLFRLRR